MPPPHLPPHTSNTSFNSVSQVTTATQDAAFFYVYFAHSACIPTHAGPPWQFGNVGGRPAVGIGNFKGHRERPGVRRGFSSQMLVAFGIYHRTTVACHEVRCVAYFTPSEESRPQINLSNKDTASLILCLHARLYLIILLCGTTDSAASTFMYN